MFLRRNQNKIYSRPDGMFNVNQQQWRAAQANQSRHTRECGNPGSLFRDPPGVFPASACHDPSGLLLPVPAKLMMLMKARRVSRLFVHHEGQEENLKASRPPIIPALVGIQWRRWARLVTGAPGSLRSRG